MSRKLWLSIGVIVIVGIVAAAVVFLSGRQGADSSPALTKTFGDSPSGFTFRYPESWKYFIPIKGLMVAGDPDTLNGDTPGPSFTIQRTEPVSVYDSLDAALDQYLNRGALSPGKQWHKLGEITRTTFLGRDALTVELQGLENAASPEQRVKILATTAQNSFIYYIILSAPVATWETDEPLLKAVLDSLQILE